MNTEGQDSRVDHEESRIQSTQPVSRHTAENLGGRMSMLEEALQQIMNQQVLANAGQLELREMVQALSAKPSRDERGKAPAELEPSIHSSKRAKAKVPNIANYRPEKYVGWMAQRSSDVIEVWLHKWEEAFVICEIRSDLKKIRKATHMFIEAVDRWWIKQQKDKVAPTKGSKVNSRNTSFHLTRNHGHGMPTGIFIREICK